MGTSERILWDMCFSWNHAQLRSKNGTISTVPPHTLDSSATLPISRKMSIICPSLPWRLTIPAKQEIWEAYVTVQDVLRALDEYFHTPVTVTELSTICAGHDGTLQSIRRASRIRRVGASAGQCAPVDSGMTLRVDVLGEDTMFAGLRPLANNEHFILDLATAI
ncbi:hypothetical protein BDY19DRAFT_198429 [Irpex rosettiformis]|uniref:Uncharacterized protein n=1 Tax=Irpex rosettiformis TaxID=378272 RepID=A0ACB8U298_9APHY|nr:hypothetical protein BDY19DRAFT_198429 [Irpex rosettiformis]